MTVILAAAACLSAAGAQAADPKIKTEPLEYKDGQTVLKGYLAYDESTDAKRPGVLVFSEWYGLNEYAKSRARQLAALGYVALAADMYGDGKVAESPAEAAGLAEGLRRDRKAMRVRALLALTELERIKTVDPDKTAAIGYCLGGTVALELARSGAVMRGVVSFHGGLDTPNPADGMNIKCKVLVCHGAKDPHVDANQVAAFQKEMTDANVDWHMIVYSGAVHAFTNPASGNNPASGVAYNEKADRRSWTAMKSFFDEVFYPLPGPSGPPQQPASVPSRRVPIESGSIRSPGARVAMRDPAAGPPAAPSLARQPGSAGMVDAAPRREVGETPPPTP
jgi:dienelactone hydrolase